jgi:hypothetical protein
MMLDLLFEGPTRLCSDPAVQRPGCAATRLCGDPAVQRPGCAATRLFSDPAAQRPGCAVIKEQQNRPHIRYQGTTESTAQSLSRNSEEQNPGATAPVESTKYHYVAITENLKSIFYLNPRIRNPRPRHHR